MTLHKYPRKQASSISQSSANRPFQKTVPDASSSSYISPFLSFPGLQCSHSSVPSPSLHALAIGAPHAEQICERLLYLRVPDEGYDTPSGWAGGATSRWRAGLPVFVHCQSQWGLFGAESIPGGVRRKALGRAFGQCGVTYSTQGPFQLTYFITSTQPCKYSQELADNSYAPKATCYPFAHFTTLKCLTIISFQKQAQLSKQQSLPLQKYGNTAKYTPHCCFCLAMITFLLFKKTLSTAASFQQLPKVEKHLYSAENQPHGSHAYCHSFCALSGLGMAAAWRSRTSWACRATVLPAGPLRRHESLQQHRAQQASVPGIFAQVE